MREGASERSYHRRTISYPRGEWSAGCDWLRIGGRTVIARNAPQRRTRLNPSPGTRVWVCEENGVR